MKLLLDEIAAKTSTMCDLSEDEEEYYSSEVISDSEHNRKRSSKNVASAPKKKSRETKVLSPRDKALFDPITTAVKQQQ